MVVLMPAVQDSKTQIDHHFFPDAAAPGFYALFILPHVVINGLKIVTDERAPVNISLRAKLLNGYTGKYSVYIGNGVTGIIAINRTGNSKVDKGEYSDQQPVNCIPAGNPLPICPGADYTEFTIRPDINWLEPGKNFHIFKIAMGGCQHRTDRENHLPPYPTTGLLIGIQRPH